MPMSNNYRRKFKAACMDNQMFDIVIGSMIISSKGISTECGNIDKPCLTSQEQG